MRIDRVSERKTKCQCVPYLMEQAVRKTRLLENRLRLQTGHVSTGFGDVDD